MNWIGAIVAAIVAIIKGIFGTDKPQKIVVVKPAPEVEITDGKTDKDRLSELGL